MDPIYTTTSGINGKLAEQEAVVKRFQDALSPQSYGGYRTYDSCPNCGYCKSCGRSNHGQGIGYPYPATY